jgi:hypothetical protein
VRAAHAQSPLPPDPVTTGRAHLGPIELNPRLELLDVGVDSNVFNEAEGARRDFTATIRPSLDAGVRIGRARLLYRSRVDMVYFQDYEAERSMNRGAELRAELRLDRLVPYVSVAGLDTRERPNNELDLRARRSTGTYKTGAALLVFARTALVFNAQRNALAYAPGQLFVGHDLARQLNNRHDTFEGGFRIALTSLTTASFTGGREQTRFTASRDRDSDSVRAGATFEFDPAALLTGTVAVNYRGFTPVDKSVAAFRGLVAQVDVRYAFHDRTRIAGRFARDIHYSIEDAQPYYLTTGGTVTLTQRVGGPFDVQLQAERERMAFRARVGSAFEIAGPSRDTTDSASAGIGYRFTQLRIGINYQLTRRQTHRVGQSYERRRILGAFTYGF